MVETTQTEQEARVADNLHTERVVTCQTDDRVVGRLYRSDLPLIEWDEKCDEFSLFGRQCITVEDAISLRNDHNSFCEGKYADRRS